MLAVMDPLQTTLACLVLGLPCFELAQDLDPEVLAAWLRRSGIQGVVSVRRSRRVRLETLFGTTVLYMSTHPANSR